MFETWFVVDLADPKQVRRTTTVFSQDSMANLIGVRVVNNGAPVELTGDVRGYALRSDDYTVIMNGEKENNAAWIVLESPAYYREGPIEISIKLETETTAQTLIQVVGTVVRTQSGTYVDPGTVIPNLEQMLEQIVAATNGANDAAELANTKAALANDAAELANTKAGLADDAATLANTKAGLANDAATLANTKAGLADDAATLANTKAGLADNAAAAANAAADALDDMDATATGLAAGASPTATVSTVDGHFRIALGIPKGDKGDTGDPAPASEVSPAVTTWLNANVDPVGSAVVVDSSLSIAGAAADAAKTGEIKSALELTNDVMNNSTSLALSWVQGYINASGQMAQSNNQITTDFLSYHKGSTLRFSTSGNNGCYIKEYQKSGDTYTRTRSIGGASQRSVSIVTLEGYLYVFGADNSNGIAPSYSSNFTITITNNINNLYSKVSGISTQINDINSSIYVDGVATGTTQKQTGKYYTVDNNIWGTTDNSNSIYFNPINVSEYLGGIIEITVDAFSTSSSRMSGFGTANGNVTTYYQERYMPFILTDNGYVAQLPIADNYFYFSASNTVTSINIIPRNLKTNAKIKYIAENGDDSNGDGSFAFPYATVNNALLSGAETILVKPGIYKQSINLDCTHFGKVFIKNASVDDYSVFSSNATIAESATAVTGYTKVYNAIITHEIPSNLHWIWQDNIADASTLISDADRFPMQRGQNTRMLDTRIIRCDSDNLADALNEIDTSTEFKWYIDGTTLYFSSPQIVSSTYPICCDYDASLLFKNVSRAKSVELVGITAKYMAINFAGMSSAKAIDCKATNVFNSGAFIYDNCCGVEYIRCEACGCQNGGSGDGFNGHASKTGESFARQMSATLTDCWSHDNNDDGYSDHERANTVVRGGLYEHNKKGGVVPSYGSHCSCYNVVSRSNYTGFYYTGAASDGGVNGQLYCENCIAIDNNKGGKASGFVVETAGNSGIFVNCIAIGNDKGFYALASTKATLINCTAYNNTSAKAGSGEYTIINATQIT